MTALEDLSYLPESIDFADGTTYQRLQPITDVRQCHDGFPAEARVLFQCRRVQRTDDAERLILKAKIQVSNEGRKSTTPASGPSDTTAAELKALQLFRDANSPFGPRLVAFESRVQGDNGPMPGGYITYTVMTKLPGQAVLSLSYWSMPFDERQRIQQKFLEALAGVRRLGIEPGDKGLRNVMWDGATKRCSLVDFEIWEPYSGLAGDDTEELQKWALASRPPAKNWWAEFGIKTM